MDNTEQRLIKAAELLNAMLEAQPEVRQFLTSGIRANEVLAAHEGIHCRKCVDGSYLTFTGVISAITRAFGADEDLAIGSVWNDDSTYLIGFVVRKENSRNIGDRANVVYAPKAAIDHWNSALEVVSPEASIDD